MKGLDDVERRVLWLCNGNTPIEQQPTREEDEAIDRLIPRGALRLARCHCGRHMTVYRTRLSAHIEALDRAARGGTL